MIQQKKTTEPKGQNPFFIPFNTLYDAVPFDRIKTEHFMQAIREGIKEENEEIQQIVEDPEPPTFNNTIKALETSGKLLEKAVTVMENLLSANTNDELEAIAQEIMPEISKHSTDIMLYTKLFSRIEKVKNNQQKLEPEEYTLLNKTYDAFVRNGVGLPEKKKQYLREISQDLSVKCLQFSQNVLKDTNEFLLHIKNEDDLKGLPEHQKDLAAMTAKEKGLTGWAFTLQAPSYGPFMTYAENRKLRRKMYMAQNTLGIHSNAQNNLDLVKDIVNLRQKIAQTLGYSTYADLALKLRMAEKPQTVTRFLNRLLRAYKKPAHCDLDAVKQLAAETEGPDFKLMPWDFSFYSHKLNLKLHNIDAEMLRPYFVLNNVKKGVFKLAEKLYGIKFKRNRQIPVFHKDVEVYEVLDNDGSYLGLLYTDFFPRKSKKSGAWMTSYQGQYIKDDGTNIRPHVSLTMNLTRPTANKPALLTLGEVSTFLHEFGHGLHELLSQCHYQSLSGTNVYWDFVELPSQLMENFATEKEFLHMFAYHYQTGELIPDELIQRVIDSRTFNAAYACLRQLSFGLLDMAYYSLDKPLDGDVIQFEKRAWKRAMLFSERFKTCMSTQFQHIMTGGYAAGYYSYKWAEVLDADAFTLFKENE